MKCRVAIRPVAAILGLIRAYLDKKMQILTYFAKPASVDWSMQGKSLSYNFAVFYPSAYRNSLQ